MTDIFEPSMMTTGIGSVPLADPDDGAAFVLDADVSIPFWPQLPTPITALALSAPLPWGRSDSRRWTNPGDPSPKSSTRTVRAAELGMTRVRDRGGDSQATNPCEVVQYPSRRVWGVSEGHG